MIGITLLGWGIGGVIGGVLADYIGRRRTMIFAILAYSITTGLSAFAWDWVSFALLRFLVGIAIGSEWSTGASLTAEVWPDNARGRGAGLMQCGLGIGFFLASFTWLFVSGYGPHDRGHPDLTLTLSKAQLLGMLGGRGLAGIEHTGDPAVLGRLLGLLDTPNAAFSIVTP